MVTTRSGGSTPDKANDLPLRSRTPPKALQKRHSDTVAQTSSLHKRARLAFSPIQFLPVIQEDRPTEVGRVQRAPPPRSEVSCLDGNLGQPEAAATTSLQVQSLGAKSVKLKRAAASTTTPEKSLPTPKRSGSPKGPEKLTASQPATNDSRPELHLPLGNRTDRMDAALLSVDAPTSGAVSQKVTAGEEKPAEEVSIDKEPTEKISVDEVIVAEDGSMTDNTDEVSTTEDALNEAAPIEDASHKEVPTADAPTEAEPIQEALAEGALKEQAQPQGPSMETLSAETLPNKDYWAEDLRSEQAPGEEASPVETYSPDYHEHNPPKVLTSKPSFYLPTASNEVRPSDGEDLTGAWTQAFEVVRESTSVRLVDQPLSAAHAATAIEATAPLRQTLFKETEPMPTMGVDALAISPTRQERKTKTPAQVSITDIRGRGTTNISTHLPSKSSNSLSHYRKRLLGRHTRTSHWPGRKSKFIIAP